MGITHLSGLQVSGVPTMGMGGLPPFTGKWFFVDYARGSDGNEGTADSPFQTIYKAYAKMTDGKNDVCVIIPGPTTTSATAGTQRLSTAIAQTIDSTATTGTLTWAKNACHLIGLSGPALSGRARIAPPSTYTAATFGATGMALVNVTAQGCVFANFSIYAGFSTNAANGHIAWKDSGGRNFYQNVAFLGINDTYSAGTSTNSRSLVISGSTGENTFVGCQIGGDTTTRATATYSLEFTGGSPRNRFFSCMFPSMVSSANASAILVNADGIDRWALFDKCTFINPDVAANGGSTTITDVATTNAANGGSVLFKDCTMAGYTGWASVTTAVLIDGAAPAANATVSMTGKAVTPNA